jgi:hypothetical protein
VMTMNRGASMTLSRLLVMVLSLSSLVVSCGKRPGSSPDDPNDPSSSEGAAGATGDADSQDTSNQPLSLDDARFQKYVAYREEFFKLSGNWVGDFQDLAKKTDGQKPGVLNTLRTVKDVDAIQTKRDNELKALRAKHGFTEQEDTRLWDAALAVAGAKVSDNPAFADSQKQYRDMQAKGGEEKKDADDMLQQLADTEKKGLDEASEKYGAQAVDVISRHTKEVHELLTEWGKAMSGKNVQPK